MTLYSMTRIRAHTQLRGGTCLMCTCVGVWRGSCRVAMVVNDVFIITVLVEMEPAPYALSVMPCQHT